MSIEAMNAVWELAPRLPELLADVPVKRRPNSDRAQLVALLLANRYRDRRGYVDETLGQLAAVVAFDRSAVSDVVRALDELGVWTTSSRGGRGRGTRREPGPLLQALMNSQGLTPARSRRELAGVEGELAGVEGELAGADPCTPPVTTSNHHHPELEELLDRAAARAARHREQTGWGPAGAGARRQLRQEAEHQREPADRWLADGHAHDQIVTALVSRLVGDNDRAAPQRFFQKETS